MGRVVRPGGAVAACVWDHAGERSPLAAFWRVIVAVDPATELESALNGAREGHLAELFVAAGLERNRATELSAEVEYASFDEWWEPYTLGGGPAGASLAALGPADREAVRDGCRDLLGPPPFTIIATAWAATATTAD